MERRARCYGNFYDLSIKKILQMELMVKLHVEKKLNRQMDGKRVLCKQNNIYRGSHWE